MTKSDWLQTQYEVARRMVSIGNKIIEDLNRVEQGHSVTLTEEQKSERLAAARELDELNSQFRKDFL